MLTDDCGFDSNVTLVPLRRALRHTQSSDAAAARSIAPRLSFAAPTASHPRIPERKMGVSSSTPATTKPTATAAAATATAPAPAPAAPVPLPPRPILPPMLVSTSPAAWYAALSSPAPSVPDQFVAVPPRVRRYTELALFDPRAAAPVREASHYAIPDAAGTVPMTVGDARMLDCALRGYAMYLGFELALFVSPALRRRCAPSSPVLRRFAASTAIAAVNWGWSDSKWGRVPTAWRQPVSEEYVAYVVELQQFQEAVARSGAPQAPLHLLPQILPPPRPKLVQPTAAEAAASAAAVVASLRQQQPAASSTAAGGPINVRGPGVATDAAAAPRSRTDVGAGAGAEVGSAVGVNVPPWQVALTAMAILAPTCELLLKYTGAIHHPRVQARLPLRTRLGIYGFVTVANTCLAPWYLPNNVEKAMVARAKHAE